MPEKLFGNFTEKQMDALASDINKLILASRDARQSKSMESKEFKAFIDIARKFKPDQAEAIKFIMKEVFDLDELHQDLYISTFMLIGFVEQK